MSLVATLYNPSLSPHPPLQKSGLAPSRDSLIDNSGYRQIDLSSQQSAGPSTASSSPPLPPPPPRPYPHPTRSLIDNSGYRQIDLSSQQSAGLPNAPSSPPPYPHHTPPHCLRQRLCDRMSNELVVCRSLRET